MSRFIKFMGGGYSSPRKEVSKYNGGVNLNRKLVGDQTKPNIYSGYVGRDTYVPFGDDNLFPNTIDQMYYLSPIHASIIDFQVNRAIGGGYSLEGKDYIGISSFKRIFKINQLLKSIAIDFKMHKRIHLLLSFEDGKIVRVRRLLPSQVRYNASRDKFFVSENWEYSSRHKVYDGVPERATDGEYVYTYLDIESSPGQDIYPLDKTVSAFNWMYLDGQSSALQKTNIERSIFGGVVIKVPNEFKSEEDFNRFKNNVTSKEGEIAPVVLLTGDGMDNVPTIEQFPANENDNAFSNLDSRIDEKICQAHSINPIILGIQKSGSLGSGSDIAEAFPIWEANVLTPYRNTIIQIIEELLDISGVRADFKLKNIEVEKND